MLCFLLCPTEKCSILLRAAHLLCLLHRLLSLLINLMLCSTFQFAVPVLWICESDYQAWDPDPTRSAWWETVVPAASPARAAKSWGQAKKQALVTVRFMYVCVCVAHLLCSRLADWQRISWNVSIMEQSNAVAPNMYACSASSWSTSCHNWRLSSACSAA